MVACLLAGLAEANIALAQSAVADVTRPDQRSRLFGYVYLSSSLAYVVGPLAGGKLADHHRMSWFGYPTPYWAVAGLLMATLALTAMVFRETRPGRSTGAIRWSQAWASVGAAFAPGPLRRLYAANFVLYLAIFGFFRVYPMYLVASFGMGVSRESELVAWVAVPIVLANLGLVTWLARRMTPRVMAARFAAALALAMAAVVVPRAAWTLWVTLGVTALALAVCLPAAAAMISAAVNPERQGSALGANQSLQVGAEAVSGLVGGALAAVAVRLPLPVLAGLALLAAGALVTPKAAAAATGEGDVAVAGEPAA